MASMSFWIPEMYPPSDGLKRKSHTYCYEEIHRISHQEKVIFLSVSNCVSGVQSSGTIPLAGVEISS